MVVNFKKGVQRFEPVLSSVVAATENVLFICLDSVRYDTFEASDAKNMKAIGPLRKVHAVACHTLPAMMAYLFGIPPIGSGRHDLFNRWSEYILSWAPGFFAGLGWATAWLSSNPAILKLDSDLSGKFGHRFKHFKSMDYLRKFIRDSSIAHIDGVGPGHFSATPGIVADVKEIMKKEEGRSVFMTILVMDTHHPYNFAGGYHDIDPSDPEKNFRHQVKAIEFFDGFFAEIADQFKTAGNTDVIITADHGELFGPNHWGHDPTTAHLRFDSKLFEIPFIAGKLGL